MASIREYHSSLCEIRWFSSTGVFTILGGLISYGFANVPAGTALRRWQYIYLAMGALTVLFGIFCICIPDSPIDAWFLTPEERRVAVERLRTSQTGVRNHKIKLQHIKSAVLDPKFYLIFIMMSTAYTVNGAVSGFGPLIVSTFGWTTLDSILWQFPLGAIVLIFILVTGYVSSRKTGLIIPQLVLCSLPVIAGCAMIWKSTWSYRAAPPVVGYTIIGFFGPVVSLIIVAGMSNVGGQTKKGLMAANIFVVCIDQLEGRKPTDIAPGVLPWKHCWPKFDQVPDQG
jgi:MFS family permease